MTALLACLLTCMPPDTLISTIEIYHLATDRRDTILSLPRHLEAPNWTPDGNALLVNGQGKLYQVPLDDPTLKAIPTPGLDNLNNDHGLSPDGNRLVVSSYDGSPADYDFRSSRIYILPAEGGAARPVTEHTPSFWHGWSPDGRRLAYVGLRGDNFDIYTIDTAGHGPERRLTDDPGLDDGPDYSPDGQYIYYNSMASGSMELWRMDAADGSNRQQLTDDAHANWFPHPSPDGRYLVYLSYVKDQGSAHPAMKDVMLRLYDLRDGSIRTLARFIGGQGTINVPSWAPGGRRFAFVSYR